MKALRKLRTLSHLRRWRRVPMFASGHDDLLELTERFCAARTPMSRIRRAKQLFVSIWMVTSDRRSIVRLLRWIRLLEQNHALKQSFSSTWGEMLADFDFVPLFTESGLPRHDALSAEVVRRVFERLLPSARDERDMARFLASVFSSSHAVARFLEQDEFVFSRLVAILWPGERSAGTGRVQRDLRQSMRLLAARVVGRGTGPAIRTRGSSTAVEDAPFYLMLFATERLLSAETPGKTSSEYVLWQASVQRCYEEVEQVHLHMEDTGVSSALVYDLRSIEATLRRMEILMATAAEPGDPPYGLLRELIQSLLEGQRNDVKLRALVHENLNLLAQKTVERTGRGGEHYIAHTRRDYWLMWRAGLGGGLLTVFTAALKMRLMESHFPLAIEGFLIGTDYAVSFVLLQIFGFALATKQPSMTAATLAGIVRKNRGVARWSKISEFAADICRTQLAAAISNVFAVCVGAVLFERVWAHFFRNHYLPAQSAQHVYQTLHPFTSGTAIFAAFTGVLLWLAAVIGGWFENFIVYHRVPEAISQHPLGARLGARSMHRAADWLESNAASWSTSIVLGYLLGFGPVVARFFGVPLDVRHVTLSTGTLALAAARFGTQSLGQGWLYAAIAGLAITFVMNLGVSFSIASAVALRAYNVPTSEQFQILGFLFREALRAPLSFILPVQEVALSIKPKQEQHETVEALRATSLPEPVETGRQT
jgi:site-specific recombinase